LFTFTFGLNTFETKNKKHLLNTDHQTYPLVSWLSLTLCRGSQERD
jgi:hypothetical protein